MREVECSTAVPGAPLWIDEAADATSWEPLDHVEPYHEVVMVLPVDGWSLDPAVDTLTDARTRGVTVIAAIGGFESLGGDEEVPDLPPEVETVEVLADAVVVEFERATIQVSLRSDGAAFAEWTVATGNGRTDLFSAGAADPVALVDRIRTELDLGTLQSVTFVSGTTTYSGAGDGSTAGP